MSKSRESNFAKPGISAFSALVIVVILGLVVSFFLPHPARRRYPNRTPVVFWHCWTGEWNGFCNRIADRFNESQTQYEVLPLSVPWQVSNSKILLGITGGDPPDLVCEADQVLPKWAESGMLTPLDDLMTPEQWRYFRTNAYPIAQKIGMYKGKLYGVSVGMNCFACYYRADHVREAGLDPDHFPQTLEGLEKWAAKLNKYDKKGNLTRIGFLPVGWHMYAPGFGSGFYDWKTGKVTIDTPENLRALEFLSGYYNKLGYDNIMLFQSGLDWSTGGGVAWPFISGSYSITVDGAWRVEQLSRYAPELDYRIAPIPPPAGGNPRYGWNNGNFMIIPKGAKQSKGAWEFIKFWSGIEKPERAAEIETWGGWMPLFPSVANAPIYREYVRKHPQFQSFLDLLPSENIQPTPPVPYQVFLMDNLRLTEDRTERGQITPRQAITGLEHDLQHELARRKEFGLHD